MEASTSKHDPWGVFWSFTSAFLWATTFVCVRHLMSNGLVDPVTLSTIRFLLGGSLLLLMGLVFKQEMFGLSAKDFLSLAILGLLGMVGMSTFSFYGQIYTTAINSSLIMQLNPIIILLLGVFIGEAITLDKVIGIVISLIGCLFVVGILSFQGLQFDPGHLRGDLFVLLGAVCWALYSIIGKPVVQRLGGYRTTTWAMLLGAIELLLLRFFISIPVIWPSGGTWYHIAYLVLLPTAVAFFAWYEAMARIDLALLNVMQYLTPIFTILLAWLLLGERLGPSEWAGVLIVLLGVVMVGIPMRREEKTAAKQ
jgi:drug/metabolite transporter (DMT)-like permease